MTRFGLRSTVLSLSLLAMLAMPAVAHAQRRVAVPRSQSNVIVGARSYSPHYLYRPYYYGPSYRSLLPCLTRYSAFSFSFGTGTGLSVLRGRRRLRIWVRVPGYGYGYPYAAYPDTAGFYDPSSSVRLQVMPREAEVYVDGFFAGMVDNFDGTFQRLRVAPGDHELQLFMPGHRSFSQKVYLQPGGSFNVRHAMEPLAAGEPEPTRPWLRRVRRRSGPNHTVGQIVQTPVDLNAHHRPRVNAAATPSRTLARSRCACSPATRRSRSMVSPGKARRIRNNSWSSSGSVTHTVEIRKDGYRTYIQDVTVRRGETTPLNVSLTRQ